MRLVVYVVVALAVVAGAVLGAFSDGRATAEASAGQQEEPPSAAETAPQPTPDLEEFIPTEELPADSAVAFPVDI